MKIPNSYIDMQRWVDVFLRDVHDISIPIYIYVYTLVPTWYHGFSVDVDFTGFGLSQRRGFGKPILSKALKASDKSHFSFLAEAS